VRITPKRKLQKAQAEYSKARGTHYKHKQAAEKAALAVKEEVGGVKCMSIERGPNGRLENLERMLSEVKRELLIGDDPDYFTDHGQMENAVIAIRKMLSAEKKRDEARIALSDAERAAKKARR